MQIDLWNFMSYGKTSISLSGHTIAVVGDNGVGKSTLLEAIPYAFYGIGRGSAASMSRINGDGNHKVTVTMGDHRINRGWDKGKGFVEVWERGTLVAKGREADTWIENYLGMNGETFMLTAFFGLHDSKNDTLIRVPPSVRLETLQMLGNIGPYSKFLDAAKKGLDEAQKEKVELESSISGAESVLLEFSDIEVSIAETQERLDEATKELVEVRKKKKDLEVSESRYRAFVKERDVVDTERANLVLQFNRIERAVGKLTMDIREVTEDISENLSEKEDITRKLQLIDINKVKTTLSKAQESIGGYESLMDLKQSALEMDRDVALCPLCGATLADDIYSKWEADIVGLEDIISKARKIISKAKVEISSQETMGRTLDSLTHTFSSLSTAGEQYRKKLSESESELKILSADIKKKENRLVDLNLKLGSEYQTLQDELRTIDSNIYELTDLIGGYNGELKQLSDARNRRDNAVKAIAAAKRKRKSVSGKVTAYTVLREAWSRYGIPMELIRELGQEIEQRASAVYQEFDSGAIEVREVTDRGRPGVEFYLVDKKGERTFSQLSAGEKVMFFISIRVAVSLYISERANIRAKSLILDEAMGNLSMRRRDDLIRAINKVLRNLFSQVIMVSHTEMRDIFSQTISVSLENDMSVVTSV